MGNQGGEALSIIQPSWEGGVGGGGGSSLSDSHLSKLWRMQPQHSPSPPRGGEGVLTSEITWPELWMTDWQLQFEEVVDAGVSGAAVFKDEVGIFLFCFSERRFPVWVVSLIWAVSVMHSWVSFVLFQACWPTLHSCMLCSYVWNLCRLSHGFYSSLCCLKWFFLAHFET